jgi:uncharacterized protein YecE (DUF72 family)
MNDSQRYYAGTSGLVLPFPKYKFPPEHASSSRLTFYASLFRSIEINSSFYKLPQAKTISKWANEVPAAFRFTFKLWKEITHIKNLDFKDTDVEQFIRAIDAVGNKSGCLLIQFPPSLKSNSAGQVFHLLTVLGQVDAAGRWPVALEFRDKSWYDNDILEEIESFNASVVIHDKTGSATPSVQSSVPTIYLRFHGPSGDYRGSYSNDFLMEYAEYIRPWLEEGKQVYVYFNNTAGEALENLNTLNRYLHQAPS